VDRRADTGRATALMAELAAHELDEKNCTSPLAAPGRNGVSGTVAHTMKPPFVTEVSDDHAIVVPAGTKVPFNPSPEPEKAREPTESVS
jgi:hypothetical protein